MADLILHHYDLSPYAEKIRLIMGLKGLEWKSVQIPIVMPKPDLTCLTGGYRKTPVLQIGADIYCDTKTIARALERVAPQPSLYPRGGEATERALGLFGDSMFMMGVVTFLGAGVMPEDFIEDRKKMIPGGFDIEQAKRAMPAKRDQIRCALSALDAQLADGRHFLLGPSISLADFSVYHPVWFLSRGPATADIAEPFKHVAEWRDRIEAIGHGKRSEIPAEEAVAVARDASPETEPQVDPNEPNGYKAGDRIVVMPEDYGPDPVSGTLVRSDADTVAVRRRDDRVGEVVVHFPRQGYIVLRSS